MKDINSGRFINWRTLSYPEDRERVEHLYSLVGNGYFNVVWAIHDMDKQPDGTLDKPHCHAVIHLPNSKTRSAFAQCFSIRERLCLPITKGDDVDSLDMALLYLIHADPKSRSQGKYQYPLSSIKGPWASFVKSRIQSLLSSSDSVVKEADSFLCIQSYIESNLYMTMSEVARWCASHGHWAAFRRCSGIIRDIIREHNDYLRQIDYKNQIDSIGDRVQQGRDIEALYEAVGIRTLRALDGMLESAGRPSLKLKRQIQYVDEVVHKSKGKANAEVIRRMLHGEEDGSLEGKKSNIG